MTIELHVTKNLREQAERDGSDAAKLGVHTVEMLTRLILGGRIKECEALTEGVCNIPDAAHTVIAMAIGVIAQCELNLRNAQGTLSAMIDQEPEALAELKKVAARDMGISPEKFEALSKQMDEAIKSEGW